jgi:hypothetical protein
LRKELSLELTKSVSETLTKEVRPLKLALQNVQHSFAEHQSLSA